MTRASHIIAFASLGFAALTAAPHASAQVVAYRHRSTVFGDHAAGASELVRAQGAFLRDHVAAAREWVDVAAARDQLNYQRAEYAWQLKQMRLDYLQQKAAANRERQQLSVADEQAAADRLLEAARRGLPVWPVALRQPQFATSMALVESLLRNWSPDAADDDIARRALATEAGVLRTRIASDLAIPFNDRVAAVQTLQRLQILAGMPVEAVAAGPQLAMK